MDTKWKKSRAALGFLAFVLGVSLLLEGVLYFGTVFASSSSRRWLEDSFQPDWRDTAEFRSFISSRLETLITMGAGGYVYGYNYYYDAGRPNYYNINSNRAQAIHNSWKEDENILYRVDRQEKKEPEEGKAEWEWNTPYSSSERLSPDMLPSDLPEGYTFLLQFDGEKVRIWKDGTELDVYGDGYYRFDAETEQWYIPGYRNFTVDEAGSRVKVTLAVIDRPQIFIKGNYGKTGPDHYNQLYYLNQNLVTYRQNTLARAIRMGVGVGLFLVYRLLRKSKKQADLALARFTGNIWFEVKILAALVLVTCFLPRMEYFGDIWRDLTYSYIPQMSSGASSTAAAAGEVYIDGDIYCAGDLAAVLEDQGIAYEDWLLSEYGVDTEYYVRQSPSIGTAVTILSENGGWLLREYLSELTDHTLNLLVIFWGLYLLIFNDWRYNKKPWKQGVFALLAVYELEYPLQKRLSRMNGFLGVALFLLWTEVLALLVLQTVEVRLPTWAIWNLLGLPWVLSLGVFLWFIWRQRRLWREFGAVAGQAAAIRAGDLTAEADLSEGSDLRQLSDDLCHIGQGLHQAVEERTRSERMKVELVTNVSHDLKTPLTSIISYTELLSQEPLEPPASEYVKIMGEKAHRLKAMVQDVFEVSKAASGQLPVKLERLDYARLLRQTLADMAQTIADSGLALRTGIPEEEVPITADSDRLYRVFQNLIGNALKYSLPGSRVYLTLAVEGEQAAATVRNTSAAELKPGVEYTARFVRGDESRTDGGSGLGLSIAESFAQACGGELTISTEADLFTVTVTFPLAK